jgi:hypothetical protein
MEGIIYLPIFKMKSYNYWYIFGKKILVSIEEKDITNIDI